MNLKNFSLYEFNCQCGCNDNKRNRVGRHMNEEFLFKLDMARTIANIPFIITSGYRCLIYNKTIGSKNTSSHVSGCAVDISTPNSISRYWVLRGLMEAGFTRLGIGERFVHVDDDALKPPFVAWDYYDSKGESLI